MSRQIAPREYTCCECAQHLNYMSEIPQRQAGVMMYLGDHFCTHTKRRGNSEKGLEEQGTGLVPSAENALRAADILLQIA